MKKVLILLILFLFQTSAQAVQVYSDKGKFGLKDGEEIIVRAQYEKLIRLGEEGWIIQTRNKFGIINNDGKELVKPKYRHVERVFMKYAKLGNEKDYGLYNEYGIAIIPPEYSAIEPLRGKMFLTCKKYKYGITNSEGKILLENEFDDIYTPDSKTLRLKYNGKWYELEKVSKQDIELPADIKKVKINNEEFTVKDLMTNTYAISGFSVVSTTNYLLKLFTSISPAYEQTIDDLMFSKGADTVNIFMRLGWIPKFPYVYARKYYNNFITPNNGPLADVQDNLKSKIK